VGASARRRQVSAVGQDKPIWVICRLVCEVLGTHEPVDFKSDSRHAEACLPANLARQISDSVVDRLPPGQRSVVIGLKRIPSDPGVNPAQRFDRDTQK
jgi:hypothetical protein